jgi:uncharacterized membrane-anchored protein
MNYKKIIFPAFIILALAQLFVPASMIMHQESVIKTGKAFKFRTAPFDPYDPFRGKYIMLSFEANTFKVPVDSKWEYDQDVYVTLATDEEGFAKIAAVSAEEPNDSPDFVLAKSWGKNESDYYLSISYPFDRFYMEESKALEAEQSYMEAQVDTSMVAYALVKVKSGDAVIENVFIDDVPIKEVVERGRENQ